MRRANYLTSVRRRQVDGRLSGDGRTGERFADFHGRRLALHCVCAEGFARTPGAVDTQNRKLLLRPNPPYYGRAGSADADEGILYRAGFAFERLFEITSLLSSPQFLLFFDSAN